MKCDINSLAETIGENILWIFLIFGGSIYGGWELWVKHSEQAQTSQVSVEMAKAGMEQSVVVTTNTNGKTETHLIWVKSKNALEK